MQKEGIQDRPVRRLGRPVFAVPAILIVVAFIGWAANEFPKYQANHYIHRAQNGAATIDKVYFEIENEARKTFLQGLLGVFGLIAAYLTWIRSREQDKQANAGGLEVSHRTGSR